MTEDLKDAATVAVIGVAVVMAALTILMIAIMVITRLAPRSEEAKMKAGPDDVHDASPEKESVAVIAVAMALAMEAEGNTTANGGAPADASAREAGRWASAGRERLMHSRSKAGQKWGRPSR